MGYDWLDTDGNGALSFKEFLHGFDWLNDPVSGKSLLKIGHAAHKHCSSVWHTLNHLRKEATRLKDQQHEIHADVMNLLQDAVTARRNLNNATARAKEATQELIALQGELDARAAAAAAAQSDNH